ncbi:Protein CLEC16A [Trichinella spiralis]|uniref:Dimethyladenosine transferase 1, mitochondrial n=1 Tax=Trichinella spiralis TaxID=6334 RepID=A0A0V1BMJ5_TRISP|nr:Protein CLEC16A [Trichinella spiralis]
MPKGKLFSTGGLWKPKNQHSLEYLKYLCDLLTKNAIVTEQNRALLVEALRLISEILIWGDQNDSSVFDFFLEKNMLSFFLFIMRQKCGRFVCIQLLQTLNILFENIRNETSLYYLLSNNHVNSIITYRFDFSDEEILAYYISFLKTLSFKLNVNTVHFFFNEHTLDFPLYTEAIKFFNHAESMVRIAVRTLTLNICIRKYLHVCVLVNDPQVIRFIRDNTAVPYFSNLVWFIRQRANEINGSGVDRMRDLIADHQDHIHYLNDILCLDVEDLNKVLIDQLMSKLFLPVYLNSIYAIPDINDERPFSLLVTVFFLTQLFVIISYSTLVERMARILLLNGPKILRRKQIPKAETASTNGVCDLSGCAWEYNLLIFLFFDSINFADETAELAPVVDNCADQSVDDDRTFASIIFSSLENAENDQIAYFVLCLMLAIGENEGISPAVMECTQISSPVDRESKSGNCNVGNYATPILQLILRSHDEDCPVRIATLELCCTYITQLFHSSKMHSRVILETIPRLKHCRHLIEQKLIPCIEAFDTFIELFEDEATAFMNSTFNLARSCSKELFLISPSLIPPTVDYTNRPTCTEYERVRRLLRSWFILSKLLTNLRAESLELEKTMQPVLSVKEGDCMNLGKFFFLLTRSNSDLLACTVIHDDNNRCHQFLVVGNAQLYFVEPDSSKVGWGVVRFVGQLQSCEVRTEKDNRALLLMVHSAKSRLNTTKSPLFAAKLLFDDHIRCMAAKQRLTKGCSQSRKYRLVTICDLLHVKVPEPAGPLPSRVFHNLTTGKANQMLPGFVVVHGSSGNPGNETASPVAPGPSRPFSPKRRSRLAKFTGSKVELSPTNSSNEEPKKQDDIDGVVEEMRCIDLGQSPKPAKLLFSQKFNTTIANAAEVTDTMDTETAGETESTEKAANNENTVSAPLPDHLKPTCMIVLGMAGSGKSTLVQRICAYLSATKTSLYPVNLDPAVHYVSYPTAVDIRESVNYKEIMQKYELGPNGGIMTAMNIFATTFGKVIDFLENSSINYKYAVFDTPGQIEVFTWSASGAIISQTLASSFPTVIVYVMDVARSSSPITFTSNMLYACSIMYKTQLPMVVAMNKTDIISANFALDWINDFECFLEALDSETSFAGDLTRRLALGLEEFYKTLKCTGVSAISGEGMKRFFELIDQARLEYETDYKPELEQRKLQLDKKKIEKQAERLNRLKLDIASDPPQSHIASLRENFFGDQFCFGGLQDDDSAEDEEYEKPSSSGVEPIPRPSAPDRASSRWFPFVYGDKTEMRGETSDGSYSSSVGSALLVLVCWTIGRSDCSIFWMLALLGLVLLRNHLLRQRSRRIRAHQVTALQEKEVIVTQLKDLPTWVQFPDVERVEWINRVIAQTWPGIANFAKDFLKENIEPQIKDNLPSVFRSFCFESIDIGDIPVRVGGIKVYAENVGRDRIVMDMDVAYAGDCSLSVKVGCFRAGVEQLQFQGKLRCILRPLISKPPWFGGFVIFFLNEPAFEFDLTGAGELVEMPGLMKAMRSVISSQLANICVLPNEIVIPVVPETKMCDLTMSEPQGIVRVGVIAATNLENKDSFLKGKSDPYVRITVGGQIYQTKTIENNLNPVWNEEFDAIVDHADGQYLGVELYDEDPGSRDEFLGNLDLDMDSVRSKGYISDWYALNAVKHGNVNLSVHWMNLSSDASLLDDVQNLPHSVPSSGPRNHALLMIYVDCIKNLPSVRKSFEPSPFILLTFGNEQRKTSVKMKTNNPVYQQRFVFLVKNVHHDILKLEAKDKTSGRSLGEVAIPVRLLKEENNMELKQQTWHLALGPHLSPITMTLKLRFVRTAGNLEGNYVCEVGPGPGGITRAILEQNPKKLVVVEKDPRFLPTLELIAESSGGIMDIRIGDVMKYEIETEFPADVKREWSEEPPPVHVIGNLPFNVSTYLIIKWLRAMSLHEGPFVYGRTLLTLTFQKEVGLRMLAPIFNRHRCRLSVMCQYLSDVKRKFTIPGRACVPSPDVDVAVMQFRPKVTPVIPHHFDLVEKFCRHVFHYRNKYCIRGIETLFPDFLKKDFSHEILRFARVSPKLAPPALAIEEIRDMCKIYEEQCLRVPSLFYYDYRQRKDFEEVQRNCPAEPPLLKHLSSNVETFSERL